MKKLGLATPTDASDSSAALFIPPECFVLKPWFDTRPSHAVIKEIKDHILKTGKPHTWRGHTHTKPLATSPPVYLEEFDLPLRAISGGWFAPCPICTSRHPKYARNGKIAWFPEEKLIRLVGPQCFRSLNPDSHDQAESEFRAEQQRRKDTEFLLSKLPRLNEVVRQTAVALFVSKALDTFHGDLHSKLLVTKLNFWPHVKNGGQLRIVEKQSEFRKADDGSMDTVLKNVERIYSKIEGFECLNPEFISVTNRLQSAVRKLETYNSQNLTIEHCLDMPAEQRQKIVSDLSGGIKTVRDCIEIVEVMRKFVGVITINTLRSWGRHEGNHFKFEIGIEDNRISVGRYENQCCSIILPNALTSKIGNIIF